MGLVVNGSFCERRKGLVCFRRVKLAVGGLAVSVLGTDPDLLDRTWGHLAALFVCVVLSQFLFLKMTNL